MRFVTIIGARPQFIKAAPLSVELRRAHTEILVHTGQHYDDNMSEVFFRELNIPAPDRHLGVGSGSHGAQTAAMLQGIEQILEEIKPDAVIIYGDTNSTLAAALAAVKMHIPVAHVEAGLRSFNREMPEEINRIVADSVSHWLFAPSQTAVDNLAAEGVSRGVHDVGDIMADCVRLFGPVARQRSTILQELGLEPGKYCLATVHRAGNTDVRERLAGIFEGFRRLDDRVVLPLHPRTKAAIGRHRLDVPVGAPAQGVLTGDRDGQLVMIEPVGYLDMLQLQQNAAVILTDSGGVQKEAYYAGVPCVTLREETEWVETVELGWNRLVGTDPEKIVKAAKQCRVKNQNGRPELYGNGHAAKRITEYLSGA